MKIKTIGDLQEFVDMLLAHYEPETPLFIEACGEIELDHNSADIFTSNSGELYVSLTLLDDNLYEYQHKN